MERGLRELVRRRAGELCEYCRLPQSASPFASFHVEHIVARQHGGSSQAENLALACSHCNFHKGPNIAALDPNSGQLVSLFNRLDRWVDHFAWQGAVIIGVTPQGRATVELLLMNHWQRVDLREELGSLGDPFAG